MLCFIIWVIILMFDALYISSANRGDSLDRKIDQENLATKDFLILVSKNNSFAYARCLLIWISFTDVAVRRITRKLKKSYQRKWSFSTALLFRTGMQSFMSKLMTTLTLILVNTSSSWKLCLLPIRVSSNVYVWQTFFDLTEGLIGLLESRRGQDGAYIGCMKSGDVVTQEFVYTQPSSVNIVIEHYKLLT